MESNVARAAAIVSLALLSYFQFPGHAWLAQDSQIYAAILEHQHDRSILANDPLVREPHLAFTVYDEVAEGLRRATRLSLHAVLAMQQIAARALGIWGVDLLAGPLPAAIYALGAPVSGPAVFTVEYEPTPRAIALPLLLLAMGLAVRRRCAWAATAAGTALLYHPPACWPVFAVFVPLAVRRREWRALAILSGAAVLLIFIGLLQGGQALSGTIPPWLEELQRMRAPYAWVSLWAAATLWHWAAVLVLAIAALVRLRAGVAWMALAAMGVLAMPLSWLLLEHVKLALLPQFQPMRALAFTLLAMQLSAAAAAVRAMSKKRWAEGAGWLFVAFLPQLAPLFPADLSALRLLVCAGLAALAIAIWRLSPKFAPAAAIAGMFAIPTLGGVVNYTPVETPELRELSAWARANTPPDAVFLFPDVGHGLEPGVFRGEAMRAVYVDWKSGGQVNFWPEFARDWWTRWEATRDASDFSRLRKLGIGYVALRRERRAEVPVHQNADWVVYDLGAH